MLCGCRRSRWQSIRINGGKTTLGLGSYPEFTLDMVRERALENAPSARECRPGRVRRHRPTTLRRAPRRRSGRPRSSCNCRASTTTSPTGKETRSSKVAEFSMQPQTSQLRSPRFSSATGAGVGVFSELGDGAGKWRLWIESEEPLVVESLLSSPTGHLTNLTTAPESGGS